MGDVLEFRKKRTVGEVVREHWPTRHAVKSTIEISRAVVKMRADIAQSGVEMNYEEFAEFFGKIVGKSVHIREIDSVMLEADRLEYRI
jgi:hypothetical protein